VIVWDRGRPARKRAAGAQGLLTSSSRFALSAGGAPAVPDNHLMGFRYITSLYR